MVLGGRRYQRCRQVLVPVCRSLRLHISQHAGFAVSGGVVAVDEGEEAFFAEGVPDSVAGADAFGFEAEVGWSASAVVFDFDVHFRTMFASATIDDLKGLLLHTLLLRSGMASTDFHLARLCDRSRRRYSVEFSIRLILIAMKSTPRNSGS